MRHAMKGVNLVVISAGIGIQARGYPDCGVAM